jgi:hypothetical protein
MSERPPEIPEIDTAPPLSSAGEAAANTCTSVCLGACVVLALQFVVRGLGPWSLLPAVVGIVAAFLRWRVGVGLFLMALFWLILSDSIGTSPGRMIEYIVLAVASLLIRSPAFRGYAWTNPMPKLQAPAWPLDLLMVASTLTFVIYFYRLLALTHSVFPIDPRRHPPVARGRHATQPIPASEGHRREPGSAGEEPVVSSLLVLGVSLAALLFWGWLRVRQAAEDLAALRRAWTAVYIADGPWQLLVFLWAALVVLVVASGVLSYLASRRMTPEEAELYLQDELWGQTRREQCRSARWLAWAEAKRDGLPTRIRGKRPERLPLAPRVIAVIVLLLLTILLTFLAARSAF